MNSSKHIQPLAGLCLSLVILLGCATPDTRPFTEATGAVGQGVRESGRETIKLFSGVPYKKGDGYLLPTDANHPVHMVKSQWAIRVQAVAALEEYSMALSRLGTINRNAAQSAQELATPLESLLEYFPSTSLPKKEISSLVALIIRTVKEIRSSQQMEKMVKSADTAFAKVVPALAQDLSSLKNIYESTFIAAKLMLHSEYAGDLELYSRIDNKLKAIATEWEKVTIDPNDKGKIEQLRLIQSGLREALATVGMRKQAYDESLARLTTKGAEIMALIETTQDLLSEWCRTHQRLVRALEENRQPNFVLITVRAQEIRDAIEAIRN